MKIIVLLPTWNEAENITPMISQLLDLGPEYEALVVDDNSPDETWRIVAEMAHDSPRVHLLRRMTGRGRGLAGLAGFRWLRDNGADIAVEMDADFSHHTRFVPALVEPVREGRRDIVIGSRLVPGGGETGRNPARTAITRCANLYIRLVLGLRVRDCTSGFRAFSRRALERIPWESMTACGPEIIQEVLFEARRAGLAMEEYPILFQERRAGQSTFNAKIAARSLAYVARLRLRR